MYWPGSILSIMLYLYKSLPRQTMDYYCPFWTGVAKCLLSRYNRVQNYSRGLISNAWLSTRQPVSQRCNVSSQSILYGYFYVSSSDVIHLLVPPLHLRHAMMCLPTFLLYSIPIERNSSYFFHENCYSLQQIRAQIKGHMLSILLILILCTFFYRHLHSIQFSNPLKSDSCVL